VYFGHHSVFKIILVILEFSGLFWGVFECILVIRVFRVYFGHFGISGVILVILEFSKIFLSF
jgi:hypothetical protein